MSGITLNCWIMDNEPLALALLESYVEKVPFLRLTGKYSNALSAVEDLHNSKVDVMFLDIQMPDLNGMEFAKMIDGHTKVIFTTAFPQYALDGFRLDALDYLLKPFTFADFLNASKKALTWFEMSEALKSAQGSEATIDEIDREGNTENEEESADFNNASEEVDQGLSSKQKDSVRRKIMQEFPSKKRNDVLGKMKQESPSKETDNAYEKILQESPSKEIDNVLGEIDQRSTGKITDDVPRKTTQRFPRKDTGSSQNGSEVGIFVRSEYMLIHILYDDILFIEGLKDYVKIYSETRSKPILSLMSLKDLENVLPSAQFIRIHRSFIVNKNKISTIQRNRIAIGNKKIPIGQTYRKSFFEELTGN